VIWRDKVQLFLTLIAASLFFSKAYENEDIMFHSNSPTALKGGPHYRKMVLGFETLD